MFNERVNPPVLVDYEADLNDEQLAVVRSAGGPTLVIAGAGSGKTRAVTYRVAYLIESGVDPGSILLVTFTNKAAREMLSRVEALVPAGSGPGARVWGGTFHHIANRILRRHATLIGYQPNFTILDREDSKDLVETCITELKMSPKGSRFPKGEVVENVIGLAVNMQRPLADILMERYPFFIELADDLRAVADRYVERKRQLNAMDFDDLLCNWRTLLQEHPEVRARYGEKFQHILVDEYQDTNRIQAAIIDLLAERHKNLMVVGDDSQSIYSFRGANFANILSFPERYAGAKVYKLEVNYRSTPEILYLANRSIQCNRYQFPKELRTIRTSGPAPSLYPAYSLMEQAAFVAQKVSELQYRGVELADIAVLYRSHYQSLELQMELTRRGFPYEIRSGLRFFEQAHVKDVSAYLKVLGNPLDELAWKRLLQLYPGIGKVTAGKIFRAVSAIALPLEALDSAEIAKKIPAAARGSWVKVKEMISRLKEPEPISGPGRMIERVMEAGYEEYLRMNFPNYESRIEDLRQLASFAEKYTSLEDFLSEMALMTTIDEEEQPREAVGNGTLKLTTVHQAKGLEWSVVFVIGLAEGRFPAARSLAEEQGEEEERRLFYVAVTRAKDELYLCYPRFAPDKGGREMIQRPSRFIAELCGEGYEKLRDDGDYSYDL